MTIVNIAKFNRLSGERSMRAVEAVAVNGVWAVTPDQSRALGADDWCVTHLPSGRCVPTPGRGLSKELALRMMSAMAALPDQDEWALVTEATGFPKHLMQAGRECRDRVLAESQS